MLKLLALTTALTALAGPVLAQNPLGAPPPLAVYGKLPAISHVEVSPSGTHVAMVLRQDGQQYVVDYDVATESLETQPVGDIIVNSLNWVDDTYLTFTSRQAIHSGEVRTYLQGLILNVRDHQVRPLTGTGRYRNAFVYDIPTTVTKDGRKMVYMLLNEVTPEGRVLPLDLFSIEPASGEISPLFTDVPVTSPVFGPDGAFLGGVEYKFLHKEWRLKFNHGSDWKTVLEQTGRLDVPDLGLLGRDGKSFVLFMNEGEKRNGFYEVSADGTFSKELNPGHPYSAAVYHPATWRLAGFANQDNWVSYDFSDPVMKTLPGLAKTAFGDYRTKFVAYADDPRKVVVYTEGADDAGTYFFVNFGSGNYAEIGRAYPELPPEWITEKKAIRYKAADGVEIEAFLTLPPGRDPKSLPLVVMPHGGPEARDDLSFEYDVQALASRGYAVLQPNFRGSDGYGRAFNELGYGEWGRKMQTDLSDGVRHIAGQGLVDPKRVCIWGSSYGGYAALAGVTFDPGVYRCSVAVSAVSDLPAFLDWEVHDAGGETVERALYWKRLLGDETLLDDYSPARHADRIDAPVLLVHGKDDTTVPLKQTQTMIKALQAAGKTYEFVELNGEDHFMSNSETRLKMLQTAIGFIEKNNPAY